MSDPTSQEIDRAARTLERAREMLTLADVCRRLRTDRRTLYKLVDARLLRCYRFPRIGYRFEPEDVQAFQEQHRVQ